MATCQKETSGSLWERQKAYNACYQDRQEGHPRVWIRMDGRGRNLMVFETRDCSDGEDVETGWKYEGIDERRAAAYGAHN